MVTFHANGLTPKSYSFFQFQLFFLVDNKSASGRKNIQNQTV